MKNKLTMIFSFFYRTFFLAAFLVGFLILLSWLQLQFYPPLEALDQNISALEQGSFSVDEFRQQTYLIQRFLFINWDFIKRGSIFLALFLVGGFGLLKGKNILEQQETENTRLIRILKKGPKDTRKPYLRIYGAMGIILTGIIFVFTWQTKPSQPNEFIFSTESPLEYSQGNWNSFRGPQGGVAGQEIPLRNWDTLTGQGIKWKVPLLKESFSSPIVWEKRIFLTGADEEGFIIYAVDLDTGDLLFEYALPRTVEDLPPVTEDTGWSAPTPTVHQGGIYTLFADGTLVALSLEGELLWSKDFGLPANHYGHASSPIIFQNALYIQWDQSQEEGGAPGFLLGLNSSTGEEVFRVERREGVSWSSPLLAWWKDQLALILNSTPNVSAYNAATGDLLWQTDILYGEIGPSSAVLGDVVFSANEYATLVALDRRNGEVLWEAFDLLPETASLAAYEDKVFVATSYGVLACFDAITGDILWETEVPEGFYSSPLAFIDGLLVTDRAGRSYFFSYDGELLGTGDLGESVDTTPAVTPGGLLIKGKHHLFYLEDMDE